MATFTSTSTSRATKTNRKAYVPPHRREEPNRWTLPSKSTQSRNWRERSVSDLSDSECSVSSTSSIGESVASRPGSPTTTSSGAERLYGFDLQEGQIVHFMDVSDKWREDHDWRSHPLVVVNADDPRRIQVCMITSLRGMTISKKRLQQPDRNFEGYLSVASKGNKYDDGKGPDLTFKGDLRLSRECYVRANSPLYINPAKQAIRAYNGMGFILDDESMALVKENLNTIRS